MKYFRKYVAPVFADLNVNYFMMCTEFRYHAQEVVRSLELSRFSAVCTVSGDGLLNEVLAGIALRDDATHVLRSLPLSIIPAGTGNALAASLHPESCEHRTRLVQNCSLTVARPDRRIHPLDIIRIETCAGRYLHAFLSVAWGIVSDVDIGSEKWRFMGDTRFTVEALIRIAKNRSYKGTIWYLAPDSTHHTASRSGTGSKGSGFDNPSFAMYEHSPPTPGSAERMAAARQNDGTALDDSVMESVDLRTSTLDRISNNPESARDGNKNSAVTPVNDGGVSNGKRSELSIAGERGVVVGDRAVCLHPSEVAAHQAQVTGMQLLKAHARSKRKYNSAVGLPPIHVPLREEDGWVRVEGPFYSICGVNMTHLATDMHWAPEAAFDDGFISLSFVRAAKGVGRKTILDIFDTLKTGAHTNMPEFEEVKTKAFRVVPGEAKHPNGAFMAVDGEEIEYGPYQAEILSSVARLIVPPDHGKLASPSPAVPPTTTVAEETARL